MLANQVSRRGSQQQLREIGQAAGNAGVDSGNLLAQEGKFGRNFLREGRVRGQGNGWGVQRKMHSQKHKLRTEAVGCGAGAMGRRGLMGNREGEQAYLKKRISNLED